MHRLLVALALFTGSAQAGVYLEMSHVDLSEPRAPAEVSKFWAQDGRARTEAADSDGEYMIFRDQQMIMVQPKKRSYRVMDKTTVDALGARMADMRRQMEAQMANLPPEQRAAMQRMMGGRMPGAAQEAPKRRAQATSRSETVGGRSCRIWEIYEGTTKDEELCVVPPGSLPGGDEFYAIMKNMAAMMEGMVKALGSMGDVDDYFRDMERIDGIPILSRDFSKGKATDETRMSVVRKETVPPAAFEVPKGFKKLSMGPDMDDDGD